MTLQTLKVHFDDFINVVHHFVFVVLFCYNVIVVVDLPNYPNVDKFCFETMKKVLLEKLDSFHAAPFTIQRICELLADPRKQYSRIDKFMRAIEKNILGKYCNQPQIKVI